MAQTLIKDKNTSKKKVDAKFITKQEQKQNMNWFDIALIVVVYYSYTNGSHEGVVEFCVIEVFKFWDILRWMKKGCKSLILGMPRYP